METVICQYRSEIPKQLVLNGYTEAQAQAIYHHWVAPMDDSHRLWFLSMVYNMEIAIHTALGIRLLVTSQGW